MERTQKEIDRVLDWATSVEVTRYPGMSYEEGVADALRWVVGEEDHAPDEE